MSSDAIKNTIDIASLGTFVGYVISALPVVALIFTVLWALFRVLEMRTTHVLAYRLFKWRMDKWLSLPDNPFKYKSPTDE